MNKRKSFQNGITLIALVISIIVMLILAGVSLNATIGDNGIITQAQNAKLEVGMSALEEWLQQFYIENYDEFQEKDNKALALKNYSTSWNWFYQGAPLGYIVDSDGNSHYFINKDGLPNEIKNKLVGGDAGNKTYADYASLNDVYGVTSDLKVYYCRNGKNSIIGISKEDLEIADSTKEIFEAGSSMAKLITGENGTSVTLEDLKQVKNLVINNESNIKDLKDFYALASLQELTLDNVTLDSLDGIENAVQLNKITIQNCTINNYSALGKMNKSLNTLYLYRINDEELNKLCSKTIGIGNSDLTNLKYLAIVGSTYYICSTEEHWNYIENYNGKGITTLEPLNSLTDVTKKSIKYLSLNANYLTSLSGINDFTNLYLLRAENNCISDISGIKNMKNLSYLYLCNNKIESLTSLENNTGLVFLRVDYNLNLNSLKGIKECKGLRSIYADSCNLGNGELAMKSENDALYDIKDLSVITLNLINNQNLIHIAYGYSNLGTIFLSGCTNLSTSEVAEIKNIYNSLNSGNKSIDEKYIKYLNSNERIDYYQYSDSGLNNKSDEIMYLYNNKDVKYLRLDYNTQLTDNVSDEEMSLNEILSTCSNIVVLSLRGLNIDSIDFVKNMPNLKELDLWDCNNIIDLTPLENTNIVLSSLRINNSNVVLSNIPKTLSSLEATGNSHTFLIRNGGGYESGLYASKEVYEKVGTCTELTNISWCNHLDTGAYMDLSNTKLVNCDLTYPGLQVKLPSTCETAHFQWNAVKYVPDLSLCSNLRKVTIDETTTIPSDRVSTIWNEWFFALSNCTNLEEIYLEISGNQNNFNGIEKLSNCLKLSKLQIWHREEKVLTADFTGIGLITSLKNIKLNNFNIKSVQEFSTLINLETLDLSNNLISTVHGLENLKNLNMLKLENNCIFDTTSIKNEDEVITYNNLEILADLNKTGNLRKLYLSGNNGITNWTLVSNIKNWEEKSGW